MQDKKSILENKHALLAEKRAEALRANLKKRKNQSAARQNNPIANTTNTNQKEETAIK